MTTAITIGHDLDTMTLGTMLAKSGYFQDAKEAAQAVVKVLAGQELGIGPVASMTGIYIVKGRVTLSANLIAACIKRSGRYDYRVNVWTDTRCAIEYFQQGKGIGVSEFTKDDADRAGLSNSTDTWRKYPRNMLFARAMTNGARIFTPDVFAGPVYTPDELGATVNEEGQVIEAEIISNAPPAAPMLPEARQPAPQTVTINVRTFSRADLIKGIKARWAEERALTDDLAGQNGEQDVDLDDVPTAGLVTLGKAVRARVDALKRQETEAVREEMAAPEPTPEMAESEQELFPA